MKKTLLLTTIALSSLVLSCAVTKNTVKEQLAATQEELAKAKEDVHYMCASSIESRYMGLVVFIGGNDFYLTPMKKKDTFTDLDEKCSEYIEVYKKLVADRAKMIEQEMQQSETEGTDSNDTEESTTEQEESTKEQEGDTESNETQEQEGPQETNTETETD